MSTPVFFFVAVAGEALTMKLPDGLQEQPFVRSKNISPNVVGDLDFLVTGEREREPDCIREEPHAAVFRLDGELVAALADLEDDRLPEIADEWGIFNTADTITFLHQLRNLAQAAQVRDEELFLCF